jgi:electron transport complex protein RnfC
LQQAVATVEKRLAAAQQKLQQAEQDGSDKLDAFKLGVEKTAEKLQQAQQALANFIAANPAPVDAEVATEKKSVPDAAQQAIARAQQQRARKAQLTPEQKARQAVESLTARIAKAKQKLATARSENDDNLAIFETTLVNLQDKLADAEQALSALPKDVSTASEQTVTAALEKAAPKAASSAADDAIARALAKRQAASTMTDEERLQNAIESLQKRLAKTREKLASAEATDDSNASILADSVSKLEVKLTDAQQAYDEYQQQN